MNKFALTIPGLNGAQWQIQAPSEIPTGPHAFQDALQLFIQLLFIAAILLAFFFLFWSGFRMIILGEKKEEIAKARTMLVFSLIGLGLVFLAFLIVRVVGFSFDVNILP